MSGWIQAFIVIAAVAIVIQMAILLGMFFQVRTAIEQFTRIATDLQNRIDPILLRTNRILEDSDVHVAERVELPVAPAAQLRPGGKKAAPDEHVLVSAVDQESRRCG